MITATKNEKKKIKAWLNSKNYFSCPFDVRPSEEVMCRKYCGKLFPLIYKRAKQLLSERKDGCPCYIHGKRYVLKRARQWVK
jgi:hypothetical protein